MSVNNTNSAYFNNINQIISDNLQYAQAVVANPGMLNKTTAASTATANGSSSTATTDSTGATGSTNFTNTAGASSNGLDPSLLMLMMLMLQAKNGTGVSTGLPSAATGLGNFGNYYQPPVQSVSQNPLYQDISQAYTAAASTTTTSPAPDVTMLTSAMDAFKSQINQLLPDDPNVKAFTQQINTLETQAASMQTGITQAAARQNQVTLADQLETKIKTGLTSGTYHSQQVGQALMGLLANGNDNTVNVTTDLIGRLVKQGIVNPSGILNDRLLSNIANSRQAVLSDTLSRVGLVKSDGTTQSAFAGQLLQATDRSSQPLAQQFSRDLLSRYAQQAILLPSSAITGSTTALGNYTGAVWQAADKTAISNLLQLQGFKLNSIGQVDTTVTGPFTLQPNLDKNTTV